MKLWRRSPTRRVGERRRSDRDPRQERVVAAAPPHEVDERPPAAGSPWSYRNGSGSSIRRCVDAMVANIAGARLVVIDGVGHIVSVEEPERVITEVTRLLSRTQEQGIVGDTRASSPRTR